MKKFFVDLHVHIGRSSSGREVKKATAGNLTFENIAHEALYRKGINVIGVVDCISPHILEDIDKLMDRGGIRERRDGGLEYGDGQALITGAEIETREVSGCTSHSLVFFPSLAQVKSFSREISKYMKNIKVCCTIARLTGQELFRLADGLGGIYIPAHAFTPHKSFYGNCCDTLHDVFDDRSFNKIPAVELGLSADSMMASRLSELDGKAFISNSDAHSLIKMGREYNIFEMESPCFEEVVKALKGTDGRRVAANYGLNPRLGKYHRTFCLSCSMVVDAPPPVEKCPVSDRHPVVVGVLDRIELIKDRPEPHMEGRAPYHYQVPLEFLPGVGPKTIDRLIRSFGTEMNILHKTSLDELKEVVSGDIAENIILAREGRLGIEEGGGGVYGRIEV